MLDIKFIRENKDLIKEGARKKHIDFDVDALVEVDDKRKALLTSVEAKKARQNEVSAKMPTAAPEQRQSLISEMQAVKAELNAEEENLKEVMKQWQTLMVAVPNIPDMSVPEGSTDEENTEIRAWGQIPNFDFPVRNHIDLMEALDMADFERGTKVSGFRGYFLKNDGALLNFALWQFVMDHFVKKGFTPMIVPSLVRKETLIGSGYLPQGEEDLYKTQDNEYLAGTGEVAAMAYYSDEIIDKEKLPMKIMAFSPCFRREAGSHGKDTKGLMRVHEFFKLEQVVLSEADHRQSVDLHEEITKNAEEVMQLLNIPYHVVVNCGGDLGLGQVKKYDIEAWLPSEGKYRETHSASYFHDFQTRRLNIRYRDTDGKLKFTHSLNSTALPTPRPLIALIENNQTADGSIIVPEALRPYMGGKEIIHAKAA
jgi:seryl-tRNA synthetase